jgi:hypothetical protein
MVARPIANADSASIAQAWFQGLNPQLDDRAPARLFRDGDLGEVGPAIVAAERAFLPRRAGCDRERRARRCVPTVRGGLLPSEWLATRRIGMAMAASLWFVDVAHSESLAHLRERLAARLVHYGLDDLDAGALRRRAPRALTQEISRHVFEHGSAPSGEPVAGIAYRSRLGDELTNWAVFEGHHLDEIVEADAVIAADDPDLVAALQTLGLTLAPTV